MALCWDGAPDPPFALYVRVYVVDAGFTVMLTVLDTPEPSAAVAFKTMVPAEVPFTTHFPPVEVSLVDWMVPYEEPDLMDQVTCLSSADDGDVVAVTVTVEPTVTDVDPEKEMEVTGVDVETAIRVMVWEPSRTPPTLSTLALALILIVPALEMVPVILPR